MASPQKENGYTPIANEILEQIVKLKLNGTQFRIIMIIWRYTYGFSRKESNMSLTFIAKALSIQKKQVYREINKLIDSKIVTIKKEASFNSTRHIAFNKDYQVYQLGNSPLNRPLSTKETTEQSPNQTTEQSPNQTTKKTKNKKQLGEKKISPHKIVIDYFHNKHFNTLGIDYLMDGGKDGKLMQTLLKTYDVEFLKSLIDWYFDTEDDFINKAGRSIGGLKISISKFIASQQIKNDYTETRVVR